MIPRWGRASRALHVLAEPRVVPLPRRIARRAALDLLLVAIGQTLTSDPSLGAAVDFCEPGAPRTEDLAIEGAAALNRAVVLVTLVFTAPGGDYESLPFISSSLAPSRG